MQRGDLNRDRKDSFLTCCQRETRRAKGKLRTEWRRKLRAGQFLRSPGFRQESGSKDTEARLGRREKGERKQQMEPDPQGFASKINSLDFPLSLLDDY